MSGLEDKVVLVTGASSGIGAATAVEFALRACKLSLVARNKVRLAQVAQMCTEAGAAEVFTTLHDLSSMEECNKAVEETFKHFGAVDILVNNAGIIVNGHELADLTMEDFDTTMQINVKSALQLTKVCVQHLEKSDIKSVVNVSSIAGLRAYPGALAYKMSKAAMDQMTRCNALELIKKGIRVNSVNPGVVETDIFSRSGMSGKAVKAYYQRSEKTHPIGRPGKAEEVAKVIAFLASPEASLVVGQTLAVDGGRSIQCPS